MLLSFHPLSIELHILVVHYRPQRSIPYDFRAEAYPKEKRNGSDQESNARVSQSPHDRHAD